MTENIFRNRRTQSPSTWHVNSSGGGGGGGGLASQHFRTATSEPVSDGQHFQNEYSGSGGGSGGGTGSGGIASSGGGHFSGPSQRGRMRGNNRPPRNFSREF